MTVKYANLARLPSRNDVVFLISSFDGWVKGKTASYFIATSMINDPADKVTTLTRYGYRAPVKSDGTAFPDNWYLLSSSAGDAAEQATEDDMLNTLSLARICRWILWYPPAAWVIDGSVPNEADIMAASRTRHLASPNKMKVPFAYILTDGQWAYDHNLPHTWLNENNFATNLLNDLADPAYLKLTYLGIANRPVIGLYPAGGAAAWDTTHLGTLTTAITGAGYGTPIYIQCSGDTTISNTLGCQYLTNYLASLGAATHHAYADQITACKTTDTPAGLNAARCFHLQHCQDNRARAETNGWTDTPLYTEYEQFLRDRWALARSQVFLNPNHLLHMYSMEERDEGDTFFPTAQSRLRGAPYGGATSYGVYIDALINVRNGTFPATYDDHYAAWSFHANVGASLPAGWALVRDLWGSNGGTTGAYQYTELQNSTTTNARTWTVTTTRIKVYGAKRVGLGHIGFSLDAGAQTDVDQGSLVGTGYNQLLYDSGVLSNTSHTLAIARISGTAAFDEVVVSISR